MSYFLSGQKLQADKEYKLEGEEAGHVLLSRRIKKGEKVNLQGVDEKRYLVEVVQVGKKDLVVNVLEEIPTPQELKAELVLLQSAVSEKALDFIFQKSTELQASKIILFNSQNTATRLTKEQFEKKYQRWNKILWEAAKQSDRVRPPKLEFLEGVREVLSAASGFNKFILLDPEGDSFRNSKFEIQNSNSFGIVIGPEGGFTSQEVSQFKKLPNCQLVSLGPILLRAETAAIASLAICKTILE